MIRMANIGYAFSARTFHMPFIQADSRFQLAHIVTGKPGSVKLDFPDIAVVPSYTLLEPDQIDLVVVATPNHLRCEIAGYFLNARCHVVLEKAFVLQRKKAAYAALLKFNPNVSVVIS